MPRQIGGPHPAAANGPHEATMIRPANRDAAMIRLENVSKAYGAGSPVLRRLNLEIRAGQLAVLVGPSGCGKSTALSLINRLNEPSAGIIRIEGQNASGLDPVE